MKRKNVKKLCVAAILCSIGVVGSLVSFPIFGSKCAPIQHMINVIAAVLLGPVYGVSMAFVTSLARYILGLGSLLAFPGSMIGALLCGIVYKLIKNKLLTAVAEMFGTGILGGLAAYPVAILLMDIDSSKVAFYAYIIPFLVSTVVGSLIAYIALLVLDSRKLIDRFKGQLNE